MLGENPIDVFINPTAIKNNLVAMYDDIHSTNPELKGYGWGNITFFGATAALPGGLVGDVERLGVLGGESFAKGLGANPFKGKSFGEIDKILTEHGFKKVGPDPAAGKGSYFHPKTGRKYYLDKGGVYKEGVELSHVDVHQMEDGVNLEKVGKRRYPLGENLIEENMNKRGINANF